MSAGAWSRSRSWAEELWNRHVRYRELYRQLDLVRAALKARSAWLDGLPEEELAEVLCGLAACIDAVEAASNDGPDHAEGAPAT
ncbi:MULTISPECIES: hypothetical protein [unclassified Streptomyces]|uniref:hypothetical protein n=1 Tax=unclassified Streptomyces TaxID=2593676 RepID=UPI0003721190|nr:MULTISPECIES: hypothetical protein [unclassified Streptomyces]MYT31062.1 hypothetical protein [Streptomyces sp. SID8354]